MAEERIQRRLAAILAADVVGYSRLMGVDETGTLSALKQHRAALIDPAIAEHRGRIVKLTGDGVLAEFPSAVDAVECAIAIQQGIVERNIEIPEDRRIVLRIGVNLGDIIIESDDIYGDGVNVAARLEGLAEPGGICISAKVYEEVGNKLDAAFEDLGPKEVKNISSPVHTYRVALVQRPDSPTTPAMPLPDKPSIAVLPFDNMSSDPEKEYFADGLAEEIITTLSKISNLFVIARHSSFAFKGQALDVREVARKLGIRYVLEGSVRAASERLRVTAQLIDAVDGRHLWAERYDRHLDDLFDIQDNIMREIVTSLRIKLLDGEQATIWLKGTNNVDAWLNAMEGIDCILQVTANAVAEGRDLLERATAIDPNYASAHAWIARSHNLDAHFGFSDDRTASLRLSIEVADRALAIDPCNVHGLSAKGSAEVFLGLGQQGVDKCRRAVKLAPNDTFAKIALARALTNVGDLDGAEQELRHAMRLNPFCPIVYYGILANVLEMQERDQEAIELLRRALAQNNDYFSGHLRLASLLGLSGQLEEAEFHASEACRLNPRMNADSIFSFYKTDNPKVLRRFIRGLEAAGIDLSNRST